MNEARDGRATSFGAGPLVGLVPPVARRARIHGRVQGVFFRVWTSEEARQLGLAGWVRNCADGSVEAHFEGEAGAVERMIALLHEGPPHAEVSHVEVSQAEPEGLSGFEVRH